MSDSDALSSLLAAEKSRCELIRKQDFAALGQLLHADLVHVHTRGNQDTRDSYLRYIAEVIEILHIERQDLAVKIYGDCAVMHGVQISTARSRKKAETVVVKTQVVQVWVQSDGWQQVAFQATALGDLPPPAPR